MFPGFFACRSSDPSFANKAGTEVDYETAYHYDAEVQAQIEDENGNVLGSGTASGNPSADTFFDVIHALLCIRISIISYVIVTPHFLGCDDGRFFDIFGFSDYWWGWYWDFGDFSFSRRNRCIFGRLIFIATIISDFIRCLPADVVCDKPTNQLLPRGLMADIETPYLTGLIPGNNDSDHVTITCRATNPVTGSPQSGVLVRFGFSNYFGFANDGGHQNHAGTRPQGSFSRAAQRTDSNGVATSVYTAPFFGGTVQIRMTAEGSDDHSDHNMEIKVPALQQLQAPGANDGYVLTGSSESGNTYHPNGHYGRADANNSLRQIASDYRGTAFPQAQFPNGQPDNRRLQYNDQSLIWGGKFDITQNFTRLPAPSWQREGPHREHKVGINADVSINTVPDENVVVNGQVRNRRRYLEEIFASHGSSRTLREFCLNHWHLRFEGGNGNNIEGPINPDCNRRAAGSAPADGVPAALPGVIQTELYDDTGADGTRGSFVPDNGNDPTDFLVYNYPQVLPITGAEETSYVPTVGGQWMSYTVNIASSGNYTFTARVASPNSWNTFHLEVDGVDITGPIYIPNTGSGDTYQFVGFDNIPLVAGQRTLSVVIEGSGPDKGNFDYFTIDPYYPPQYCNPEWWEIQDCQNGGGSWDYGICGCQYYGCLNRWCEIY